MRTRARRRSSTASPTPSSLLARIELRKAKGTVDLVPGSDDGDNEDKLSDALSERAGSQKGWPARIGERTDQLSRPSSPRDAENWHGKRQLPQRHVRPRGQEDQLEYQRGGVVEVPSSEASEYGGQPRATGLGIAGISSGLLVAMVRAAGGVSYVVHTGVRPWAAPRLISQEAPRKAARADAGDRALLLLAIGCTLVLWPFLSSLLWAAVICFSTWPVYARCEGLLGGRRSLAAALMTLLVTLVLVAPLAVIVVSLADSMSGLIAAATRVFEQGPPAPPPWVAGLPVVGESLAAYWQSLA